MVKFTIASLFILVVLSLEAQKAADTCSLDARVWLMETDQLEHVYIATLNNEIIKADRQCRPLYIYSNNYLGLPTRIDASNPINILVYYPVQQTIVTLDVTMNEISRTPLLDMGYLDIRAVCSSNDGNLWLLDGMDFKLKKINRQGRLMAESENLLLLLGRWPEITFMQENMNRIYLLEKSAGIYIFDNFGNFKSTYPDSTIEQIQAAQGKLFYSNTSGWMELTLPSSLTMLKKADPDKKKPVLVHFQKNTQYVAYPDAIQVTKH
jgi:hypothetical protein